MIQLLSANVIVAVRANDAERFKGWLYEGLQERLESVLTKLVTLGWKLNTKLTDPKIVKLIAGVLGYAAEMERKAILKRTAEGRAVAQAAGVKMGRKRTWDEGLAYTVQEMRDQGLGYGTIGTKLGITASKVRRILNATAVEAA